MIWPAKSSLLMGCIFFHLLQSIVKILNILGEFKMIVLSSETNTHPFTVIVFSQCFIISFESLEFCFHFICFLFELQGFLSSHTQRVNLYLKLLILITGTIKFLHTTKQHDMELKSKVRYNVGHQWSMSIKQFSYCFVCYGQLEMVRKNWEAHSWAMLIFERILSIQIYTK